MSTVEHAPALRVPQLKGSAADCELVLRALRAAGYPVEGVRVDGEAGYRKALATGSVDLVIADLGLPGFDGREVLALAQQLAPDVPVIVVPGAVGEKVTVTSGNGVADGSLHTEHLGRLASVVDRALRAGADQRERADEPRAGANERHRTEEALRRREAILEAVAFAAEQLLRAEDWREVAPSVLEHIGVATDVDRVVLARVADGADLRASLVAEWHAPDLERLRRRVRVRDVLLEPLVPDGWVQRLRAGETVQGALADITIAGAEGTPPVRLPERLSTVAMPLRVQGRWWGMLGLLARDLDRSWTSAEIEALRAAGQTLTAAIERQGAVDALHASEQRFRRLADNAPDVIFRVRLEGGLVVDYVSPSIERMTGYTVVQWQDAARLLPRVLEAESLAVLEAGLAEPVDRAHTLALGIRHRDGHAVRVEVRCAPVHDPRGTVVGYDGIARDVTERETTRHALRERLKELTCLSAVGRDVQEDLDLGALAARVAGRLPEAVQWPDAARPCVQLDDAVAPGPLPEGCTAVLEVPVLANGAARGRVAVGYTELGRAFLAEEEQLLRGVADLLGLWLARSDAARDLLRSEARFRRLAENAQDTLFRYRLEPDRAFEYMSPASTSMLGYTPEEHYADPDLARKIIHPDDLPTLKDPQRQLAGPTVVRWQHRDGHDVWTEQRTSGVFDEDGRLVALEGILRDITAAKQAEEALAQRAAEQEAIADLGSYALERHDLPAIMERAVRRAAEVFKVAHAKVVALEPDGSLRRVASIGWDGADDEGAGEQSDSHAGYALLMREPVILTDSAQEERFPHAALLAERAIRSGVAVPVSSRQWTYGALAVHSTEPSRFDADDVAFCQALANVLADAVDRDTAERAVAKREREFRLLAEHSPDIIARFDLRQRFSYVNPVVETKTGIAPETLLGRSIAAWSHLTDAVDVWDAALTSALEHGSGTAFELELATPDGPGVFETQIIPETRPDGTVESVLSITRDVTDRHRSEQELLETVERLRRIDEQRRHVLDRLVGAQEQERKRIAADIHDDSIQVMVAAALRLEALAPHVTSPSGEEILGKLSRTVQRAIMRLRRLMFELRPPQLDRDGLAPAIRTALETSWDADHGPTWEVTDHLHQEPPAELRTILYRIAQEAIANIRRHARATHVSVLLEGAQTGYRMRVHDDGRGFDVSNMRETVPGHMGVMSMHERAELAGGWLQLRSTPGKGTTVEVWLPAQAGHDGEGGPA